MWEHPPTVTDCLHPRLDPSQTKWTDLEGQPLSIDAAREGALGALRRGMEVASDPEVAGSVRSKAGQPVRVDCVLQVRKPGGAGGVCCPCGLATAGAETELALTVVDGILRPRPATFPAGWQVHPILTNSLLPAVLLGRPKRLPRAARCPVQVDICTIYEVLSSAPAGTSGLSPAAIQGFAADLSRCIREAQHMNCPLGAQPHGEQQQEADEEEEEAPEGVEVVGADIADEDIEVVFEPLPGAGHGAEL